MIVVMETWHLKPGLENRAVEIMQEYDDLVGPPAHEQVSGPTVSSPNT